MIAVPAFFSYEKWDGTMFDSGCFAHIVGTVFVFNDDSDSIDSIVEVEMRSSQPLPEEPGILRGKYLVGSNESMLIFMTADREYRLISMEELELVYRPGKSRENRRKQLMLSSEPYEPPVAGVHAR